MTCPTPGCLRPEMPHGRDHLFVDGQALPMRVEQHGPFGRRWVGVTAWDADSEYQASNSDRYNARANAIADVKRAVRQVAKP